MQLDKTKNTKRNIVFGLCNKLTTILLPFFVRTIMIKVLGAEYLGLDGLFTSILTVLNLSELGFGQAIVYSMYRPIAENDTETICALLELYRTIYRRIGIVIGVVGVCLLPFLPNLISGTYPSDIDVYVLYLIYLSNTAISYMLFAYKASILNAFQRVDIVSNISTIAKGILNLLQIVLLLCFKNYYVYLVVLPLCTILENLLMAGSVKKRFPQYICRGKVSKSLLGNIKHNVAGLMVSKLCMVSRNAFDSIFISMFFGLAVTAMYTNYYYVSAAVTSVMSIISTSLLAGVGNSVAIESAEKNYSDICRLDFIYMLIGGWCAVCLLCLYQPFMKIWVGGRLMFPFGVVVLFVLYFYALKVSDIRAVYVNASGLWWENRFRAIIEASANIVLNFILGKMFGVYGIITATLVSLLIFSVGYGTWITFKYYFKNGKMGEYYRNHLRYALTTGLVACVTYCACRLVRGSDWIVLIVRGSICCILPGVLYLILYCKTEIYAVSMPWLLARFHLEKRLNILIPKRSRITRSRAAGRD